MPTRSAALPPLARAFALGMLTLPASPAQRAKVDQQQQHYTRYYPDKVVRGACGIVLRTLRAYPPILREFSALWEALVVTAALVATRSPHEGPPATRSAKFAESWSPSGPPRRRLWPPAPPPSAPQA